MRWSRCSHALSRTIALSSSRAFPSSGHVSCPTVRSLNEIQFRLRQELGNLAMFAFPPNGRTLKAEPASAPALHPHFKHELISIADSILRHEIPLLGITIQTGLEIDWRRDYVHNISTGTPYFRRVPYLDFARVGNHKVVWELNRHQHLVLLAQAFLVSGRREYLDELFRQLASWIHANRFLHGINWASALEVAFRALSWMWIWRFAGNEMPEALARLFQTELYRHARFLEL